MLNKSIEFANVLKKVLGENKEWQINFIYVIYNKSR